VSPQRIQLRRTKGWRKPEGAVVVSRPSMWGNRFKAMPTADGWSVFYVDRGLEWWVERVGIVSRSAAVDEAIRLYRLSIYRWAEDEYDNDPTVVLPPLLGGRDLACWCPLDQPCHADVLLELANGGAS
jgi:hypothetical protein